MEDLIVELLKNKANWPKMTLALAYTEPYKLEVDYLNFYIMYYEFQKGRCN